MGLWVAPSKEKSSDVSQLSFFTLPGPPQLLHTHDILDLVSPGRIVKIQTHKGLNVTRENFRVNFSSQIVAPQEYRSFSLQGS